MIVLRSREPPQRAHVIVLFGGIMSHVSTVAIKGARAGLRFDGPAHCHISEELIRCARTRNKWGTAGNIESRLDRDAVGPGNVMANETKEIGWDTVDLQDPDERAGFTEQELDKARARRRKVVAELQRQGLIDSQGKRVKKEMPPDMQPSSKCTLPG
jgi:hypothetical protein